MVGRPSGCCCPTGAPVEAETAGEPAIRVLLCDDHRILSDALAMLIGMDPGMQLVADPVDTAEHAVSVAAEHSPDVVLMDVELRGPVNGLEATRRIRQVCPATNVVVMSGAADPDRLLVEAIEAGASGFLPKTEAASDILGAVRAAARGEPLVDSATLARVLRRIAGGREARRDIDERVGRLTEREREVLRLLGEGKSNDDIATELVISAHTVQTHVRNLLSKLRVHSKLEAVALAAKSGAIKV